MATTNSRNLSEQMPASGFKKFWADYSESPLAVAALIVFLTILFIAIFAPFISPTNPYDLATVDIMNSRLPPGSEDFSGNLFILGTWCSRAGFWCDNGPFGSLFWRSIRNTGNASG